MNTPFETSAQTEYAEILQSGREVSHVEFAGAVLASRRAAINLTVNQIFEMAAAILVLDHNLEEANARIITMLAEADTPKKTVEGTANPALAQKDQVKTIVKREVVHVPVNTGRSPALEKALTELAEARAKLDQDMYSPGENTARQKFEKAAMAITDLLNPKQRKPS